MTGKTDPLRPPTLKDLQAIVTHAANHPNERQKLVDAPDDVLKQAGLIATTDAVNFVRSLGQTKFDDSAQAATPAKNDPAESGMGEM